MRDRPVILSTGVLSIHYCQTRMVYCVLMYSVLVQAVPVNFRTIGL
jgi:hypothetical protein